MAYIFINVMLIKLIFEDRIRCQVLIGVYDFDQIFTRTRGFTTKQLQKSTNRMDAREVMCPAG